MKLSKEIDELEILIANQPESSHIITGNSGLAIENVLMRTDSSSSVVTKIARRLNIP